MYQDSSEGGLVYMSEEAEIHDAHYLQFVAIQNLVTCI